jgi:hypothetical protein
MQLTDPVWLYCERGTQIALWAEPLNALSNISFFIAAGLAYWLYRSLPATHRNADQILMIGLVALIGLGSFLFHLFANQWSELTDIVPIFLFMLAYLAHVLNRQLNVPPGWTVVLVSIFTAVSIAFMTMTCGSADKILQPVWVGEGQASCLNGSIAYIPALITLVVVALVLRRVEDRAAPTLLLASGVLAVSIVFRTIDHLACDTLVLQGHAIGTHFIWHLLNGLLLYLLLRAMLKYQTLPPVQEIIPPQGRA